eukprot:scaffold20273_cov128-Isochrysis_galbana.AAC.2
MRARTRICASWHPSRPSPEEYRRDMADAGGGGIAPRSWPDSRVAAARAAAFSAAERSQRPSSFTSESAKPMATGAGTEKAREGFGPIARARSDREP